MATGVMHINNKIEIYKDENEIAKSIVQEVIDEDTIAIAVPVLDGLNYVLDVGEKVFCNYIDAKGNLFSFSGTVSGRKIEKIPLIIITIETPLTKIQRRDYVRVPVLIDIKYTTEVTEDSYKGKDIDKYEYRIAKAIDLSGGGMKIQTAENLEVGQQMLIKLPIGNSTISGICEIVRTSKSVTGKGYINAVKFKYIDSKDREEVIKYIFENMRRFIKAK